MVYHIIICRQDQAHPTLLRQLCGVYFLAFSEHVQLCSPSVKQFFNAGFCPPTRTRTWFRRRLCPPVLGSNKADANKTNHTACWQKLHMRQRRQTVEPTHDARRVRTTFEHWSFLFRSRATCMHAQHRAAEGRKIKK